jgi:hypothetical protein
MKSRIIIYGILLLMGAAWIVIITNGRFIEWLREGRSNRAAIYRGSNAQGTNWSTELKTPWTNSKVILYRESGDVVQLDAKSAVYSVVSTRVSTNRHEPFDVPVTVFIDPATGKAWAGWAATGEIETNEYANDDGSPATNYLTHTNLFFETDSGIFNGENMIRDGAFCWDESMISRVQPEEGLDAVIARIGTKGGGAWPFDHTNGKSFFGDYFPDRFFSSHNMGNQTVPIQRIEVGNGTLRLYIDSLQYKTTAAVWLDLKTFEVRRTIEYRATHFSAGTFYLGVVPALLAILIAAATLTLARTARSTPHVIVSGIVLVCIVWSWLVLCRIYIQGAWPTHLSIWRSVVALGDWAVYLPVAGIGIATLITGAQALLVQISKEK